MLPAMNLEISHCEDVATLLGKTAMCDSTSAMYRCKLQGKLLQNLACSCKTQKVLKRVLFLLIDGTFIPKALVNNVGISHV
jgi:hypothetical protein